MGILWDCRPWQGENLPEARRGPSSYEGQEGWMTALPVV
jgi:hypothetical protein